MAIENGFQSGLYTDVALKQAEYNLVASKNELVSNTLKYLLNDLELKKYSSALSVQNIRDINNMLVW